MRSASDPSLFRRESVFKGKIVHAGVIVSSIVQREVANLVRIVDLPERERISDLISE